MPKIITQEDFLLKVKKVHGDKYNVSKLIYVSSRTPLIIICEKHGEFDAIPINFIGGKTGCPKCAGRNIDWVERFVGTHGNKYDYSLVKYVDYKKNVKIICKEHGEFLQTPDNHYRGQQCPKCKGQRIRLSKQMPFETFVKKAEIVHKNKFTYRCDKWENLNTSRVIVKCEHDEFEQIGVNILAGKVGCQKCGNMKSAPEEEVSDYLKIFTSCKQRDKTLIKPKELDIYIPSANLAIEFHGMYWHSHFEAKTEDKDKHKTYNKYKACAEKDVRLITIYGSEWDNRKPQIKRLLRNAIGKTKGKLMARKCQVSMVPHTEAKEFFEKYHPQGGDGSGTHYGIYWKIKLVACMRFSLGSNDRGNTKTRDWTLSRYATRVNILGGASKLFKAFVKEQDPDLIKSFSDNRYFSGGMYEQLGFELVSESMPDYQVWSQKKGLFPKSHYQRRNVQKRLLEHGKDETYDHETDLRTEREMTYLMGAGRIYDCGKKKWVWTK